MHSRSASDRSSLSMKERCVLVTGSSSGIGRAITGRFLDAGATVIGIARDQSGIYPQDSPGGWRIIGRSPISFFNVDDKSPCFAEPGDKIKFQSISLSDFNKIEKNRSSYDIKYKLL